MTKEQEVLLKARQRAMHLIAPLRNCVNFNLGRNSILMVHPMQCKVTMGVLNPCSPVTKVLMNQVGVHLIQTMIQMLHGTSIVLLVRMLIMRHRRRILYLVSMTGVLLL
nr:hypothetical protein Iba_chr11dCG1050 [Ipomoea batatas]